MNTFMRMVIAIVVLVAAGVFIYTLVTAYVYSPADTAPVGGGGAYDVATGPASSPEANGAARTSSRSAAFPVRLAIPALSIDARVQETTLNSRGAMGVPTNYTDVAWYARGVVPGMNGTAVIDGHYDNGLGLDGVFKELAHVKAGDDIYITRADGTRLHFRVTRVEELDYDDPNPEKVFDPQRNRAEVKLVTCGGEWVPKDKTYDKRIVVTAELAR